MKGIALLSLGLLAASAHAQEIITNRIALNVLLGINRADERFERYGAGGASTGPGILTSTNDWGGLANPITNGVTFRSTYFDSDNQWIQWNGNGFGGMPTETIYSSGSLFLDFWNPTFAFGVDIKDFSQYRETFIAGVRVYGSDDTTLLYSDNTLNLTDPTTGVFFGFQFASGIGAVEFLTVSGADPVVTAPHVFSPKIDNLSFSTAPVPEPSTIAFAMLGLGALVWRARKK